MRVHRGPELPKVLLAPKARFASSINIVDKVDDRLKRHCEAATISEYDEGDQLWPTPSHIFAGSPSREAFFAPTSLELALAAMGFVQADPIRAPARAQDLTLRHRVNNYRAGDLERRYHSLEVEEDFFINYGFVTKAVHQLMHPRQRASWSAAERRRVQAILAFVNDRGTAHPQQVDDRFAHGTVKNYWGGSSNATTHLLDAMHYSGMLRVARRDAGVRVYAVREVDLAISRDEVSRRLDALVDVIVGIYAPLPAASLSNLVKRLRYGVPQWERQLTPALTRAQARLARTETDGTLWYWPANETVLSADAADRVRLLAPFDPVVWDRRRFERFWNWEYRFEAYTPARKRLRGYYALPLLWRDRVIGWGNVSVVAGVMHADLAYVSGRRPRERAFANALDEELARLRDFLALSAPA